MYYWPIPGGFSHVLARTAPAWPRRGVSLEQCHQPPLPARVAVDVALRDLDRLVAGEQLHVAQAAAGPMRVSRRGGNERPPT